MRNIYGYHCRNGTPGQAELQGLLCSEAARLYPDLPWGGGVRDDWFAHKVELRSRAYGNELNWRLQPGDVVLVRELFDAFRRSWDARATIGNWQGRGVDVISLAGELDDEESFTAWERSLGSRRSREQVDIARAFGRPVGPAPMGFRTSGPKGRRKIVPDKRELALMQRAVELRGEGLSFERVARGLMLQKLESPRTRREVSRTWVCRAVAAYRQLNADPRLIAAGLVPAIPSRCLAAAQPASFA